MLAPLLAFSLATGPAFGPLLPPGTNSEFIAAAVAVEDKLNAGDFSGAAKAAELLPKLDIVVQYDDSKVPPELRADYAAQRDQALDLWRGILKAKIRLGTSHPDLKFSFEPMLANPPDSGIPAGATLFWSSNPGDPRLETVIGLKRGSPAQPINPINVGNEIEHSLGAYYGLATSPFPGTVMGRTDIDSQRESKPSTQELLTSNENTDAVHVIRQAIKDHTRLIPTRPKVFFEPKAIDMGTALQGDPEGFEIQITNNGNAPLAMRFSPDCGCVSTTNYQVVQAGASFLLKGHYDTLMTVGEIHHTLLVTTNDSDQPTIMVPVTIKVRPSFRFLIPSGSVVNLPEGGTDVIAYLLLPEGSNIKPGEPQIAGIPGTAKIEPWSGDLADPEMNEPSMPRKGYKVTVHLTGSLPVPGRDPVTLWMPTGNEKFPTIQTNFFAQRGIVLLPAQLYMGEIGAGQQKFSLLLSGPANSFHIKSVTSDWPYLSFDFYPNNDRSEYHITCTYNGKAQRGPVFGSVKIETDDPKQPTIYAAINASVR